MYSYLEFLIGKILNVLLRGWTPLMLILIGISWLMLRPQSEMGSLMFNGACGVIMLIVVVGALWDEWQREGEEE